VASPVGAPGVSRIARGGLRGATPRGSAVDVGRDAPAGGQRAERAAEGGGVDVSRALAGLPRARCMLAQRVARWAPYPTRNGLPSKQ
jgi:hypothetical protein